MRTEMRYLGPLRKVGALLATVAMLIAVVTGGVAAASPGSIKVQAGTIRHSDDRSVASATSRASSRVDGARREHRLAATSPSSSSRFLAAKAGEDLGRATRFVTTPRGTTFDIPEGWVGREADNGKGIVYQWPGAPGNADSIRIMEPTEDYPNGYFRYYNSEGKGQPLDVNGKPGSPSATHHHEDDVGPLGGWPR